MAPMTGQRTAASSATRMSRPAVVSLEPSVAVTTNAGVTA